VVAQQGAGDTGGTCQGCGAQPAAPLPTAAIAEQPTDTPVPPADTLALPTSTLAPESAWALATMPHQVVGREACAACHAEGSLAPFPADHAGRTSESCQACHKAGDMTPMLVPHDVQDRGDCLLCHAVDGSDMPTPADHVDRAVELCRVCHLLAPEVVPEPERPSGPLLAIPHDVDGKEDCLGCHGAEAIGAYPGDHAGRENDQCQACHLPGERISVSISHTLVERDECRMCHSEDAFRPFPSDHRERGSELCLLCHSTVQ